jgi:hypothetical protein
MNYGQKILFDFMCISLEGRQNSELTNDQLVVLIEGIEEYTHLAYYNDEIEQCPDYLIMVAPQNAYQLFCDFFDENEEYFLSIIN